ncbi:MAG: hypothetical protein RLZZ84_1187 [Pseudomonadota bacterium]|jgi:CRP-like cAMP-binding protein
MSTFGAPGLLDLLDEGDRTILARLGNRVSYGNGELVHDRGDVGTALGIVVSGKVNLYRMRANGALVFASSVEAGQNFGDVVSVSTSNRTHHAVAEGHATVDHFSQAQLGVILRDHPAITLALYKVASHRLKTAIEMLDDARMLKNEVRLAKMLRRMVSIPDGRVAIPIMQDVLCQILGLSSVSVAHALKSLGQQGLLETGYRQIVIPDLPAFDAWLKTHDWE